MAALREPRLRSGPGGFGFRGEDQRGRILAGLLGGAGDLGSGEIVDGADVEGLFDVAELGAAQFVGYGPRRKNRGAGKRSAQLRDSGLVETNDTRA